jgi:hypothetical protein
MRTICSLLVSAFFFSQSCYSQKANFGDKVIKWINEQQKDSLRVRIDKDFHFILNELPLSKVRDSSDFLNDFLANRKFMQAEYEVTKSEYSSSNKGGYKSEFYTVHVTSNGVFQKYLDALPLKNVFKIEIEQDKISAITIDAGTDRQQSQEQFERYRQKFSKFEKWMKDKYPADTLPILFKNRDQVLIKRLEEYKRSE